MAKNPYLAAFLSFLIGGLGQIYAGRLLRGVAFFALELLTGLVYMYVNESVGLSLNLFVGLWAVVDAYRVAKKNPKVNIEKNIVDEGPKLRLY